MDRPEEDACTMWHVCRFRRIFAKSDVTKCDLTKSDSLLPAVIKGWQILRSRTSFSRLTGGGVCPNTDNARDVRNFNGTCCSPRQVGTPVNSQTQLCRRLLQRGVNNTISSFIKDESKESWFIDVDRVYCMTLGKPIHSAS